MCLRLTVWIPRQRHSLSKQKPKLHASRLWSKSHDIPRPEIQSQFSGKQKTQNQIPVVDECAECVMWRWLGVALADHLQLVNLHSSTDAKPAS